MFIEMKRFEKKQPWSFSTAEMKGESILNKIMKISSWKYCKICCRLYSVTKNHWFRHNDRKNSTIFVAEYVALNENFAFAIWRVWPAPNQRTKQALLADSDQHFTYCTRLWSLIHFHLPLPTFKILVTVCFDSSPRILGRGRNTFWTKLAEGRIHA